MKKMRTSADRKSRAVPSFRQIAAAIAVVSTLAVAHPLLDLLARNAEFFVVRGSQWSDVLALVGLVSVLLPLVLSVAVGALYRISRRLGEAWGLSLLALLLALLLWNAQQTLGWDAGLWWLMGVLAVAFALAFRRLSFVRSFFVYLSPALLLVPALFLLHPGVRRALSTEQLPRDVEIRKGRVAGRAPVVFLIFDELSLASLVHPDLTFDERRFPHLAELAARATFFRRAATAADTTVHAVPAILSGLEPQDGRLPNLQDHPRNLFTLLGGDYQIRAVEAATRLCPAEVNSLAHEERWRTRFLYLTVDTAIVWGHLALPPPLRSKLPEISHAWQGFLREGAPRPPRGNVAEDETLDGFLRMALREVRSGDRLERFEAFLRSLEAGPRERALYYYHAMLPHRPWEYLANGRHYADDGPIQGLKVEQWTGEQVFVDQAYQRYLEQATLVDRMIGETVETLERIGIYDDALIVLVADHGVAFRSGFSRRIVQGPENAGEIVGVPLVIKAPGQQEGQVVDTPVSVLGILPTIAELLGVRDGWPADARPLLDAEGKAIAADGRPLPFVGTEEGASELGAEVFEGVEAAARHTASRTVAAAEDRAFVDVGPRPDLVGREVASLPHTIAHRVKLELQDHRHYFEDLGSDEAEGKLRFLGGRVVEPDWPQTPQSLLVAVGGRLVASTFAFPGSRNGYQFSLLLPPGSLRAGFNELRMLRVIDEEGDESFELLEPMRIVAEIATRGDGDSSGLVLHGRELPLGKPIHGYVMATEKRGERLSVEGWALDLQRREPVDRILVFAAGEMLATGEPRLPNRWAVDYYGSESLLDSSFEIVLDSASVPDLEKEGMRIFAVSEDTAIELESTYPRIDREAGWLWRGDGRRYRLLEVASAGEDSESAAFVDLENVLRNRPVFWGWAGRPREGRAAEQVVLFRGGQYVTHFAMNRNREDLVASGKVPASLAASGFAYRGVPGDAEALRSGELLFVAVFPDQLAQVVDVRLDG